MLRSTCHKSMVQWVEVIFEVHSYFYTSAFSQYISSSFVHFSKNISQIRLGKHCFKNELTLIDENRKF